MKKLLNLGTYGRKLSACHKLSQVTHVGSQQGFTLVEVLIALLILGILFIPVSGAFLQSVKVNQLLRNQVPQVREAQAAMETAIVAINKVEVFDELCLSTLPEQVYIPNTHITVHPLHEDSPFLKLTVTTGGKNVSSKPAPGEKNPGEADPGFSLIALRLPGTPPWLQQREVRVWTP